jgi:diaminopropionate ammonia-lyase
MQDALVDELLTIPLWHGYRPTPLMELPALASHLQVAHLFVKVESERPLGNFKVLGGVLAALRALCRARGVGSIQALLNTPAGHALPRLICASDGNHGLAVATAAAAVGAAASIYLPDGVSAARAKRIEDTGASLVWVAGTYDDAVEQAAAAAFAPHGLLIADTSPDATDPVVLDVMAGYALLSHELRRQFDALACRPSHLFVQAGVGGLAASMAQELHATMRAPASIVVVEPQAAPCVAHALQAGHPVQVQGDLTTAADMLSCGLASAAALQILLRHGADSVLVSEAGLHDAVQRLQQCAGPHTTASGAAGLAGLLAASADASLRQRYHLGTDSVVLLVVTESR